MNYPMTEVIATRRLFWRRSDGTVETIETRFGRPTPQSDEGTDCYCPYEIESILGDGTDRATGELLVRHHAFGVDSVQALYLAFFAVGAELSTFDGAPRSDVESGKNFGFPNSARV